MKWTIAVRELDVREAQNCCEGCTAVMEIAPQEEKKSSLWLLGSMVTMLLNMSDE